MVKKLFSNKSREDEGELVGVQPKQKEGCWVVSVYKMRENHRAGEGQFRLIRFKFLYFCFFYSQANLVIKQYKKKSVPQILSFCIWSLVNFDFFFIFLF